MKKGFQHIVSHGLAAAVLVCLSLGAGASVITLEHVVDGTDNMYYDDWGHWFVETQEDAQKSGSQHASAVSASGVSDPWNFGGVGMIDISVTGSVKDAGSLRTDADGNCVEAGDCWRDIDVGAGDNVYYQPIYSVIGIWSSDATSIVPILDSLTRTAEELSHAAFLVGTNALIEAPDVEFAYLFLAENDGMFSDNDFSYLANITYNVPEPGSILLLLAGLFGLFLTRKRNRS